MLDDVPTVIQWEGEQREILDRAEDGYAALLAGLLGSALGRLEQDEPELADEVFTRTADADAVSLRRVLLAPETSCRLLWPELDGDDELALAEFLVRSLELERARRSGGNPSFGAWYDNSERIWSALGDCCFDAARGVWIEQPSLAGLTVDAASPAVVHFDHALHIRAELRAYDDPTVRALALHKLEAAMEVLDLVDPAIGSFVRRFTLVANVVVDAQTSRFSSGSMNQYVGRSIFWNVHLPLVDIGTLSEGLVHEAVHSLLYMHEARNPWFPVRQRPPTQHELIVSPWSGASLRLEPFLQACFVWYALLHFWQAAARASPLSPQRVEAGLSTARAGFLKGPLTELVAEDRSRIAQELLDLIDDLQADVIDAAR